VSSKGPLEARPLLFTENKLRPKSEQNQSDI